jgi:heat shock protein HslJ
MLKYILITSLFQIMNIQSCSNVEIATNLDNGILGNWVLKSKFLGDAIDTPCGYAVKNSKEITIEIKKEKNNSYAISGQSVVNTYFGSFRIESTDDKLGIHFIKIGPISSTLMAGPEELMKCEMGYLDMLNSVKELKIEKDRLLLGTFKKDNIPSRDGGTYFIFERK